MRKIVGVIMSACFLFCITGCKKAEWAGRYKSTNCMALEYVELYEDKTADIRYYGTTFASNHRLFKDGNKFYVDMYIFELRQDENLYEISGFETGCMLVKDTSQTFWDKLFQP